MARKTIFEVWLDRVLAPELTYGQIRQLYTGIYPRSIGYENAGHKSNLTSRDAQAILDALKARIKRDGGPLVTEAQAKVGRQWLCGMAKRLGIGDADYHSITHFRLVGFQWYNENRYRARVAPTYEAFFPNGQVLRYTALPWLNGGGAEWIWK